MCGADRRQRSSFFLLHKLMITFPPPLSLICIVLARLYEIASTRPCILWVILSPLLYFLKNWNSTIFEKATDRQTESQSLGVRGLEPTWKQKAGAPHSSRVESSRVRGRVANRDDSLTHSLTRWSYFQGIHSVSDSVSQSATTSMEPIE